MIIPDLKGRKIEIDIASSDFFDIPGFHSQDDKLKAWYKENFGNRAYPFIEVYNFHAN